MEKTIIKTKFDWAATLNQFKKGETHTFDVGIKEVFCVRQAAHNLKKKAEGVFKTSITEEGIVVKRVA